MQPAILDTTLDLIFFFSKTITLFFSIIAEKPEGVCYHVDCQRVWKGFYVSQQEKDSPSVVCVEMLYFSF